MKSCYFTGETIRNKSLAMLRKLEKYRKTRKISFIPECSAMLILDMQRYFLDESSHAYIPSALPIIPRIKRLAKAFDKRNLLIILTRHLNSKEDAKLMARWWKDLIRENDELSTIDPEFKLPNSIVIKKAQYDAFYQTELENVLRKRGISQLVVTGVMTHLCCESTARSAFSRGFTVFLPIDGTATYNEEFHWASFLNLSHGFAVPVLIEELQNYLEGSKK